MVVVVILCLISRKLNSVNSKSRMLCIATIGKSIGQLVVVVADTEAEHVHVYIDISGV